jgi:type II secretory pathway component PulL
MNCYQQMQFCRKEKEIIFSMNCNDSNEHEKICDKIQSLKKRKQYLNGVI